MPGVVVVVFQLSLLLPLTIILLLMLLAYYLLFQEEFIGICCSDAFCFRYVTVVVPVMFHWWSYQLSNYIMTGPCSSFYWSFMEDYFTSWGRCFLTAVLVRLGNEANQSSSVALHSVFTSRDPIVALRYTPSTAKRVGVGVGV